jgi:nucleoid DNA-binding protein
MPDTDNSETLTKSANARKISTTLTRKELIRAVASKMNLSTSEVADYVEATIESISKLLQAANPEVRLELRGLGVFEVKHLRAKATVRDPRTGDIMSYTRPPRRMHFRPSKLIKQALSGEMIRRKKTGDDNA